MKKLPKIIWLLVIVFMVSVPILLKAQDPFNDDTLDNPVPFDNGAILLGAAAIGYGLKKAYDKKRRDEF